jgi:hypothetical protein
MGIRFTCPSGHKLHVKTFLAGKRGVCPHCGEKFVIPTAEQRQQSPGSPSHLSACTASGIVLPSDTASASIIIGIADEHVAADSPADADASEVRLAENFGSPPTAEPPVLPPPPTISTAIGAVESPAAWHVSRRQRHRRQQLNAAIVLLAAVILLALILIWVIQRGAGESAAGETNVNRFGHAWPSVTIPGDCLS